MDSANAAALLGTLDVRLKAFALCEIGSDHRLNVEPLDFPLCHFVVRGSGYLEWSGKRRPIASGSIIMVPSGTAKSLCGDEETRREVSSADVCGEGAHGLTTFRAHSGEPTLIIGCATADAKCGGNDHFLDCLGEPFIAAGAGNPLYAAAFDAFLEELRDPCIGAMPIAECLLRQAILLLLRERLATGDLSALKRAFGDERIGRAKAAILDDPGAPHTVGSLAAISGMSRSAFMKHFANDGGNTPGEFLRDVRMRKAARGLLDSAISIKSLATEAGYRSRSQFSRAFKRFFGSDPSTFRQDGEAAEASSPGRGDAVLAPPASEA